MVPVRYSEILRDNIKGAQMEVMPGAGHMFMLEQPDQTSDRLGEFINRIPYQPGM